MKDYYATVRLQQGRLKAAMQERGLETAADLSRRSGVQQSVIGKLLNFQISPRTKYGDWRSSTLKICKALGWEPSELFPDHLDYEIPTNQIDSFVEQAQISGWATLQLDPGEKFQQDEMKQVFDEVLGTLTGLERSVLKGRFLDGMTLEETRRTHNIGYEKAQQIEDRALFKLRHPKCLKKLEGVCEFS